MRLLLDTHIALWAIADDPRLTANARAIIEDRDNSIAISAATIWEIAIKRGLSRKGANAMPISGNAALNYFRAAGYEILAITAAHAAAAENLPPLHTDPFDRLLVAQAVTEPLRLVTHDAQLARYGETVMLM